MYIIISLDKQPISFEKDSELRDFLSGNLYDDYTTKGILDALNLLGHWLVQQMLIIKWEKRYEAIKYVKFIKYNEYPNVLYNEFLLYVRKQAILNIIK